MDAILIANECVDSRIRNEEPGILCKLDIQKAFDHMNWIFLFRSMMKMGFGEKWANWICYCISTIKFSILFNGSPTGFFSSQRRLRQGDPLSPFLFIIAMESLNDMMKTAQSNSWITGFRVDSRAGNNLEIAHLQYANDTLVFCRANRGQIKFLRVIFILF